MKVLNVYKRFFHLHGEKMQITISEPSSHDQMSH